MTTILTTPTTPQKPLLTTQKPILTTPITPTPHILWNKFGTGAELKLPRKVSEFPSISENFPKLNPAEDVAVTYGVQFWDDLCSDGGPPFTYSKDQMHYLGKTPATYILLADGRRMIAMPNAYICGKKRMLLWSNERKWASVEVLHMLAKELGV
jgi:hypothetical protein